MSARLKSLNIQNFRSIRGQIVVPLNAQVVLVHGSNGMGKSSLLSALELGLTGKISHLEGRTGYKDFLTNFEADSGAIELVVEGLSQDAGNSQMGTASFTSGTFEAIPALSSIPGAFFSERCFLPQAVLGRLLEIYDEQHSNANSRLTQFVKELLRLDPLDALTEGLSHANNVTRVRKIAPAFKQLEALQQNYASQAKQIKERIENGAAAMNLRVDRLNEMVAKLNGQPPKLAVGFNVGTLREQLASSHEDEKSLSRAAQERSEIASLIARLSALGTNSPDADLADKERIDATLSAEFEAWREGPGSQIDQVLSELKVYNAELSTSNGGFPTVIDEGLRWCEGEIGRCNRVLEQHKEASDKLAAAKSIVQRATTRIREINESLASAAQDARSLANALAGIVPHLKEDMCPVCSRDYAEVNSGPLTAHIAATIATLTSEAGRLQAFTVERAAENQRLSVAQRDLVVAERGILDSEAVLGWRQRLSAINSISTQLAELRPDALTGQQIWEASARAKVQLNELRKMIYSSVSLLPEIRVVVERITGRPTTDFSTLEEGLKQAEISVSNRILELEDKLSLRLSITSELGQYEREFLLHSQRTSELQEINNKANAIKSTIVEIGKVRDTAKFVATAASEVRSKIVREVFSGSLNAIWRDLFVRLAPSEQFIPQFRLPAHDEGKVEAVLETLHKSGIPGGAPGMMLSQGNLNTAALTLFLALHLSVPSQLPWLVLDDPVQSMDDLHVAQFAALLRTLSKGLGKQLVVAVHERALFDYLTLELSPAFAGDSLLAVEISRNFDGETIADPRFFEFEVDKAVAA